MGQSVLKILQCAYLFAEHMYIPLVYINIFSHMSISNREIVGWNGNGAPVRLEMGERWRWSKSNKDWLHTRIASYGRLLFNCMHAEWS